MTGRYVYTIDGLRTDDVPSPCTEGLVHRWVKKNGVAKDDCKTDGVSGNTKKTLQRLLDDNGWETNDFIVDVNLMYEDSNSIGKCKKPNTIGMMIWKWGECWEHSHPDLWNVYDFTYWTLDNTHPGKRTFLSLCCHQILITIHFRIYMLTSCFILF